MEPSEHLYCGGMIDVYQSDALNLMRELDSKNIHPTLIFMDPPFNNGEVYPEYEDNLDPSEYFELLCQWISLAAHLLPSNGSLWLNLPDEHAAEAVYVAKHEFDLQLENWCIWHYRFAQCQPNRFLKSKSHALWFSKGAPIVNREAALVPSDRATLYNDPRIHDTERGGERMDFDVWGFEQYWGRVQGNNKERHGLHPNQLPEKYLQRVIGVCTNKGDLVCDPFCGSGTTAVVAQAMERYCITGDISKDTALSAIERIKKGAVRI